MAGKVIVLLLVVGMLVGVPVAGAEDESGEPKACPIHSGGLFGELVEKVCGDTGQIICMSFIGGGIKDAGIEYPDNQRSYFIAKIPILPEEINFGIILPGQVNLLRAVVGQNVPNEAC